MKTGFFAAALLLLIAILSCGCTSIYKEPVITVTGVEPDGISLTELTLNITLNVDNPNFIGVTFDSVICTVSYLKNGTPVPLTRVEMHGIEIKPGESVVTIPVTIQNMDLIKAGFNGLMRGELTLLLEGTVNPSFFGFAPAIPFSHQQTISLKT